jgi:hypothetical protein
MMASPSNAQSCLSEYLIILHSLSMNTDADTIPVPSRGSRMSCCHCLISLVLLATSKMKKIYMLFPNLQKPSGMPLLNTRSASLVGL